MQPLMLWGACALQGERVQGRFRHLDGEKLWFPGVVAQVSSLPPSLPPSHRHRHCHRAASARTPHSNINTMLCVCVCTPTCTHARTRKHVQVTEDTYTINYDDGDVEKGVWRRNLQSAQDERALATLPQHPVPLPPLAAAAAVVPSPGMGCSPAVAVRAGIAHATLDAGVWCWVLCAGVLLCWCVVCS